MRLGSFLFSCLLICACGEPGGGGDRARRPASFAIRSSSSQLTLSTGERGAVLLELSRADGFTGDVTVAAPSLPAGLAASTVTFTGPVTTLPLQISAGAIDDGQARVELVGTGGGGKASTVIQVRLGSSPSAAATERIAAALARGQIDLFTSLLYRCYARAGDDLLPAPYRGAAGEDLGLDAAIEEASPGLTSEQLALLAPYLVRPNDPGSVYSIPRPGPPGLEAVPAPDSCGTGNVWRSRRGLSIPVRVWIECSHGLPDFTIGWALDVLQKGWPTLTAIMGRQPLLDQGGADQGGDDALDVYLVHGGIERGGQLNDLWALRDAYGYTRASLPVRSNGSGGQVSAAYIVMPASYAHTELGRSTLHHELFHALQAAVNRKAMFEGSVEYWFTEASAKWAELHVDRVHTWPARVGPQQHRTWFGRFLIDRGVSLHASTPADHMYASYVWPLFMEQEAGSPQPIGQAWAALASSTSIARSDAALDGLVDFAENFPRFALKNLNQEYAPGDPLPRAKRYVNLDSTFPDGISGYVDYADLKPDVPYDLDLSLQPLTARTVDLQPRSGVGKVEIDLSGLQPGQHLHAQALVNVDDRWLAEPIELESGVTTFCFDEGPTTDTVRGAFTEMVLVVSHRGLREPISGKLRATASKTGCYGFDGTATVDIEVDTEELHLTEHLSVSATFEQDPDALPGFGLPYRLRAGSFSFEQRLDNIAGDCQSHASAGGAMHRGDFTDMSDGATLGELRIDFEQTPPMASGLATTYIEHTLYSDCNDDHEEREVGMFRPPMIWLQQDPSVGKFNDEGTELRGTLTSPGATGGSHTFTWVFRKVRL